jgi:PAN domain.
MGDYALLNNGKGTSSPVMKVTDYTASTSNSYGGGSGGQFNVKCSDGDSYISELFLRGSVAVDHIGARCAKDTGTMDYTVFEGKDVGGNDIGQYEVQSRRECQRICDSNSNCKAATFNPNNSQCYIKAMGVWDGKAWSGIKQRDGTMKEMEGKNIPEAEAYSDTWINTNECSAKCQSDDNCLFYTCWNNNHCYLQRPRGYTSDYMVKNEGISGEVVPAGSFIEKHPKLQEAGGWGGWSPVGGECPGGFTRVDVQHGGFIDNLKFICGSDVISAGGSGGTQTQFQCPEGQFLQNIDGNAAGNITRVQFHCGYKGVNCDDYKNVFSPACKGWSDAPENKQPYIDNARKFCSEGNNMELVNGITKPCQDFCKSKGCDVSMMKYCGQFTPEQIIKEKNYVDVLWTLEDEIHFTVTLYLLWPKVILWRLLLLQIDPTVCILHVPMHYQLKNKKQLVVQHVRVPN